MLRRDRQIRMQLHQLMDACLFALAFWIAYVLRTDPAVYTMLSLPPFDVGFESFVWLYVLLIPAAPLILEAQGYYDRMGHFNRPLLGWRLLKGCAITTIALVFVLFFSKMWVARWMVVWFGALSFVLVWLKEEMFQGIARSGVAHGQVIRRYVLLGTAEETARMKEDLRKRRADGIEVVGELSLNDTPPQKLAEFLHEYSVNGVILSAKHTYFEQVECAIRACELEGVEVWLVADFFNTQISRTTFDDFYGRPVLVFRTTPEASWQSLLKQGLDFFGAFVLLIALSWLFLLVALVIRLTSPGPILFRQSRSGLNGRPFTIYKFRTMVTDAEQRKQELEALNEMSGPVFKVRNDPRVTPVGRLLRKFSIDELPQLLNVFRGEMSLVGPRPLPVDEVKRFSDLAHRRRLSVKPGLTCLWQISGRNNVSDFKDWVRLDLEYIDNWSLWLDLKILWRTIPVVLAGTGAR